VADRDRLRQVVANLLDNALKFTPEGGHVRLTTRDDGGRALLQVSDDGPGIPEPELAYVFERFYRGERARRTHGAGLGLAIAQRLIEAHGGSIEAANAEHGGAVFTIRLPLASTGAPSASAGSS
jgi:signal transduction histidine kinase